MDVLQSLRAGGVISLLLFETQFPRLNVCPEPVLATHCVLCGLHIQKAFSVFLQGAQYLWLQNDLAQVNRTETPWIIVLSHRPMYNTWPTSAEDDATRNGA